jgi:hypothetical protein
MLSNGELSILGLIKTILPDGTTRARSWDGICDWPPDLFAAVATITERSCLYAEPIFTAYWKKRQFALSPTWIRKIRALGKDWAESGTPARSGRAAVVTARSEARKRPFRRRVRQIARMEKNRLSAPDHRRRSLCRHRISIACKHGIRPAAETRQRCPIFGCQRLCCLGGGAAADGQDVGHGRPCLALSAT